MKDSTRTFLIGLVSIVALVGFAWLLMSFGEIKLFQPKRYEITIHMNMAAGLRPNSQVEMNGVNIGMIKSIDLQDNPEFPVRVVAMIEQSVRIPATAEAGVEQMLIGGSSVLQLRTRPPEPGTDVTFLADDDTAVLTATEKSLFELITDELDQRTEPLLAALDQFNRLSETYIAVGENINNLLEPQDAERLADGEMPNVHTAVANINAVMVDAREAVRLANEWLQDERLRDDARMAIERVNKLINTASKTFEQYTRLAEKLESNSDEIMEVVLPVAEELATTLAEIRRVAELANRGEGTVARLLNNPDLYDSLNDAANRADEALIQLRLFIEKVQSEGWPLRF